MQDEALVLEQIPGHPKRVLFVLPSLLRGGAEVQTINLVNGLNPSQFEKYLVTFEQSLDQKERLDTQSVRFMHFPRRSKFDRWPAKEIARIIDNQKIDLVHCSLQMALLIGWLAVRYSHRKPKLVVALHTTINRGLKEEMFDKLLYQWLMRDCNKVLCVCHAQEKHWQRKFPFLVGKTQVIYNGIDAERFNPEVSLQAGEMLRRQLGITEQAKVITHIAGFRPEKGHGILLDAFRMVLERCSNVFLLLVGDGALRLEIEGRVQANNLANHVRFLGNLADVRPALAAADCSVLASTAETFSIAMLESLAMEVPIVATDSGGTGEAVVDHQTGFLIPVGDVAALSDALHRMIEKNDERRIMGIAGRNLVVSSFSSAKMFREAECVLAEVVNR